MSPAQGDCCMLEIRILASILRCLILAINSVHGCHILLVLFEQLIGV
ncbi:MAG: hypothetical protein Q8Q40_05630 [Methylococcaceae bacterium]|nr:hypothetical protein [Methylococcaceae bacterium]MDP3903436.1 hypothetical protein [Methylococcaceae bacterium]